MQTTIESIRAEIKALESIAKRRELTPGERIRLGELIAARRTANSVASLKAQAARRHQRKQVVRATPATFLEWPGKQVTK